MSTTLTIEHLSIGLPEGADRPFAVEDVSFAIDKGEILCVVGESGSGKSMTANALMGLLPPGVTVKAGRAMFEARDVLRLPESEKQALRGALRNRPRCRGGLTTINITVRHGNLTI